MSRFFNRLIIPFLLVGLFGCGGSGDGSDENTPSKKISISAQDTLKLSRFNTKTTIDLRSRVQAENNESLLISDVKNINGDCDILSVDGLSFNVYSRHPDVCRFEYTVAPASGNYTGSAKAVSQIVLNEDPKKGEYLHPISRTMLKNESIRFNSSDLVEPGYVLDPSSVFALSGTGTSEIGKLSDVSESGFTYQAPNTETVVRIFYTETNEAEDIVKPGIVYIAIGQNTNNNPTALDRTLEPVTFSEDKKVINIEKLVSDVDKGDKLQLVYVQGILGTLKIHGNLEFEYDATSIGHEYITYIVTDHNGGYGIGLLDFNISTYESITDPNQELIFLPPMMLLSPELSSSSGQYYEVGINGVQGFYPIFSQSLASSYCDTQGTRLPTAMELQTMWNSILKEPVFTAVGNKYRWHSSRKYLTSTPTEQVSLIDGTVAEAESTQLGYFSCVKSTKDMEWEFSTSALNTDLGQPTTIIEIAESPDTGLLINRDLREYKLHVAVSDFVINGEFADPTQVIATIDKNMVTIEAPDATEHDAIYIKAIVTDEDIPDDNLIITIGITACAKGTSPIEALESSCVYTVSDKKDKTRWTLALPSNLLGTVPPQSEVKSVMFGTDGVSFIGAYNPNVEKWHEYLHDICDAMNAAKIDGRTDWAPGMDLPYIEMWDEGYMSMSTQDHEVSNNWISFMKEHGGKSYSTAQLGQGFAGLPGQEVAVNQARDTEKMTLQNIFHEQLKGTVYFASCVSSE